MKSQFLRVFSVSLVAFVSTFLVAENSFAQVTASPEHEVLKYEVGDWDSVMTMETPDGKLEIKGVENNVMLGDKWLSSTLVYEAFGQKMVGHGVFGYDPHKKKYVGTWHDSGSPYRTMMEGTWDEATKTLDYDMTTRDGDTGNEMKGKITIRFEGKDKKVFRMQVENPEKKGELADYFTMTYTRQK